MKAKLIILALLSTLLGSSAWAQSDISPHSTDAISIVYEIPIRTQIDPALLYVIRRGVEAATEANADAILLVLDTPGGRVDITRDILSIIRSVDIPIYTFVERDAYSAGAIIALATPKIYMAPGSVIGAATPIMMNPSGGVQNLNDDVSEKMKSGVAAMVRTAAEQGGHSPDLADAMVRREVEYVVGDRVVSKKGELLTLTATEAEGVLSSGTVADTQALLIEIGLPNAEIKTLEITSAERLAQVIAKIAPVLLMLGLGGIFVEIKTPGLGFPGIAGGCALILFFFGHHVAGLAGQEDMILFLVGILLLLCEVFLIPGFGLLGVGGIILILVSLINAMSWQAPGDILPALSGTTATLQHAISNLTIALIGTVVLCAVAGYFLPKSKLARPLVLQRPEPAQDSSRQDLVNQTGIALMNLHPAGRADINGQQLQVITDGQFIEKGSRVTIVAVHGNRIVVEDASPSVAI